MQKYYSKLDRKCNNSNEMIINRPNSNTNIEKPDTNFKKVNGCHLPKTNSGSAFKNFPNESSSNHSKNKKIIQPHNIQIFNQTNQEDRRMPDLHRESDITQQTTSVLNQRYQNVRQFPNFRHRKQGLLKKKLQRCGLVLDEEVTISILRQFLQPFIYRDIECILDKYIETYFMKAFDNIRENINITAENWSQILKCSISKSLYKQYCSNATIDPFDPTSTELTDFQYFTPICKEPNLSIVKDNSISVDVFKKSSINGPTNHDVISDTNSEYSCYSINGENYEINSLEVDPINHICDKLYSFTDSDTEKKNTSRKRHIEKDEIQNPQILNHASDNICYPPIKFQKIVPSTQQTNHCNVHPLSGSSNSTTLNNHSQNTQHNPQKLQNFSEYLSNPSLSAMQSGNYLNSSHNSIERNDKNNRYIQTT